MNKRTYIILGSVLAICIISIYIVVCIFTRNGYCVALETPIDHEGTTTFVDILSVIITFANAWVLYATLSEQREQNRLLQSQHFIEQWQVLVAQQIAIRDSTKAMIPIPQNNLSSPQTFTGVYCFKMIWNTYNLLKEAIERGDNCSDWERTMYEYDCAIENIPEYMEHCEPEQFENVINDIDYKHQIAYIGHYFNIKGGHCSTDVFSAVEAFRLIYERYFQSSSTYYSHLCSMLLFLQQNKSFSKDRIDDCISILKYNLSQAELLLIKQYAEYDKQNKELILNYLFKHK